MNLLKYASDKIGSAISLITSVSADVEDMHYGAVTGITRQLELLQEAINLKGSGRSGSEALQMDIASMLSKDALSLDARALLDDYVSVRLVSVDAATLSVESRYLEADDQPLAMIGNSIFEARRWIGAATFAINAELDSQPQLKAAA